MKINNNISAIISNKHLLRNENYLANSMEKLSSGFKINHAGDDPSGMAISSKMRAQIRGLDRASQNSSDGLSVLETADGALNEVVDMIQRMRELAVQSANGTNSLADRESIQQEVDNLNEEIQRISETTEFNTKKLLDGSLDNRVYTEGISRVSISNDVPSGHYQFEISEMPTHTKIATGKTWTDLETFLKDAKEEYYVNVNGTGFGLRPGMSAMDIYTVMRSGMEQGEATISDYYTKDTSGQPTTTVNTIDFTSISYGAEANLGVQMSAELKDFFGLEWDDDLNSATSTDGTQHTYVKPTEKGKNAEIKLIKGTQSGSDFGDQASYTTLTKESDLSASRSVDGRRIRISDIGGFQMDFLINEKEIDKFLKEKEKAGGGAIEPYKYEIEITDVGPMNLQIGANEGQQMTVRIDSIDTKKLYLDQVDMSTERGATRALEQLDEALATVSATRSNIGAYSNRLEHAIKSLDQTSENMNQAISRIQDSDIAKEMTEYTKYNVLQQASTSALSQANELPQTALQLLQ